ncbi:hypothetical protein [uncultured Aquimarina sp.]|uniref:hypothetical protein n=1 Tax=uncultured Aquimarina sp. TaxID=575652 RepID=UPI0026245746|nr:hypothetical protein [uncultured Aquimarina sp.]
MRTKYIVTIAILCHNFIAIAQSAEEEISQLADQNKSSSEFIELLKNNYNIEKNEYFGIFKLVDTTGIELYQTDVSVTSEINSETIDIKKVIIEIKDGEMFNIKVFPTNDQTLFFYNKSPTNIYSFNSYKNKTKLWSNKKEGVYIKLIDFITYDYQNGKRYIIENELINLSSHKDSTQHKIFINNNLKSIIDFRVYTDFLGLIDESSNGIVSFEGNSTFFLNPFNLGRFHYLFKKFKAGVSYSRFDNDDREVNLPVINSLDLIQKSSLTAETEIDIYEVRLGKKFPYKILAKAKGSLRLTETSEENSEDLENTTTLGLGYGTELQVERFSNFGINASIYFNRYQNNNIVENNIVNFDTFSIHSEVYFFVPQSDNAFFLRMKYEEGRRDLNASANFFNIQFGYKAEINFAKND